MTYVSKSTLLGSEYNHNGNLLKQTEKYVTCIFSNLICSKSCKTVFIAETMRCCEKITVEPVLFLFMLSTFMQYTLFQDLIYETVCLKNFSSTVCGQLHNHENEQNLRKVLDESSVWVMWSSISFAIPSIISTNLLGSWGDSYGRKLPLLLPSLGTSIGTLVYVILSAVKSTSLAWIIFGSVLSGATGGFVGCIMAVTSYISEISDRNSRTSRVSMLELSTFVAAAIGPMTGAQLAKVLHRDVVFTLCLLCHAVLVVYVALRLSDVRRSQINPSDMKWKEILGADHFVGAIKSCTRPRDDNKRARLVYLLISALIIMTATEGEISQTFMYVHEDPPAWDLATFGVYFALRSGIACIPLLIVSFCLPHREDDNDGTSSSCSWFGDRAICAVGLISKISGLVLLGIARSEVPLFLVPPISMLGFLCMPAIRSLMSKQVEAHELGKVFAFLAMLQNLCTVLGSLAFNGLYPLTRPIFRGMVFEIGAAILIIPLFIIIFDRLWKVEPIDYVNVNATQEEEEDD